LLSGEWRRGSDCVYSYIAKDIKHKTKQIKLMKEINVADSVARKDFLPPSV